MNSRLTKTIFGGVLSIAILSLTIQKESTSVQNNQNYQTSYNQEKIADVPIEKTVLKIPLKDEKRLVNDQTLFYEYNKNTSDFYNVEDMVRKSDMSSANFQTLEGSPSTYFETVKI